jgi:cardiolipin synthase
VTLGPPAGSAALSFSALSRIDMPAPLLTLANVLTLLRMAMAPVLVVLIVYGQLGWALGVYVLAAVTDLLDGLAARLTRHKTTFGAMLDPMADKVLLSAAFVALTWGSALEVRIPAWLTVVTLARDLIILVSVTIVNFTIGRRMFYPSWLGKASTASQVLTAGVVLLLNVEGGPSFNPMPLFVVTLVCTVTSALHYTFLAATGRTGTELP